MPLDSAQRHQIEQDAITAAWEAERLAACDGAIALLREFADLDHDDHGDVIVGTDADGHNNLMSRIAAFLATHDQQEEPAMTKRTETQTIILSAGAQRPDIIALPLPEGLAGTAAKMAVTKMIERGWLQEVDANLRRGEPLWRETGDGHGTTLVVTDAGLQAIGIASATATSMSAIRGSAKTQLVAKPPTPRASTKQALLIAMLRRPDGATMEETVAATQWLAHTARGAISGVLKKKLGLVVTSAKTEGCGTVYRIDWPAT